MTLCVTVLNPIVSVSGLKDPIVLSCSFFSPALVLYRRVKRRGQMEKARERRRKREKREEKVQEGEEEEKEQRKRRKEERQK